MDLIPLGLERRVSAAGLQEVRAPGENVTGLMVWGEQGSHGEVGMAPFLGSHWRIPEDQGRGTQDFWVDARGHCRCTSA